MKKTVSRTPSFLAHFIIQLSSPKETANLKKMKKMLEKICQAANLKPTGKLSMLKVSSPIKGCPAYGLTQQLLTSAISIDGWPEHGRMVVLVHSCQEFNPDAISDSIKSVYPEARVLSSRFANWSYTE